MCARVFSPPERLDFFFFSPFFWDKSRKVQRLRQKHRQHASNNLSPVSTCHSSVAAAIGRPNMHLLEIGRGIAMGLVYQLVTGNCQLRTGDRGWRTVDVDGTAREPSRVRLKCQFDIINHAIS